MQTDLKEAPMFRHACRVVVLAATLGATLVLAGNALANPTRPTIVTPDTPSVLEGNVSVSWTPSTFDAAPRPTNWYELEVTDIDSPPGAPSDVHNVFAPSTSTTITVSAPDTYLICIRANDLVGGVQQSSTGDRLHPVEPDCRMFTAFQTPRQPWEIYYLPWQLIKFPVPPCLCPEWNFKFDGVQPDPKTLATIAASKGYEGVQVLGAMEYPTGEAKLILDR